MVSRVACFSTLVLVSAFLIVSMDAQSWDIAATVGPYIDFFSQNGTERGRSNITDADMLTAVAYDSKSKTMYISNSGNANVYRYIQNLNETESKSYLFRKSENSSHITSIVFDPETKTLFWIDSYQEILMTLAVDDDASQPKMLHNLTNNEPWGLAIDICNRYIYWTNSKPNVHSIERSRLDGTERAVIVEKNLSEPYGIAVDYEDAKLYWTDDDDGIHYSIGRSNLDGTEDVKFVKGTHHQPLYIAVDRDAIYWSDQKGDSIWKQSKVSNEDKEILFKSYSNADPPVVVNSIITRSNVEDIDCKVILEKQKNLSENPPIILPSKPPSDETNDTTDTEESNLISQLENNCFNEGVYDQTTESCRCEKGFTGSRCERNVCDGYCLNHGTCSFSLNSSFDQFATSCSCENGFTGSRCERDVCDNHCLNNGACSVLPSGEPFCKCDNFEGSRCEYSIQLHTLCSLYCSGSEEMLNTLNITLCRCKEGTEPMPKHLFQDTEPDTHSTIILSILIAVIGTLVIVVGVLGYHVHKLKRRPRIRKRFVVSKGGVTPLTSRPQLPTDSCEITIENCCNMNICETPCFEPKLRSPPTKSNGTKREEKNSLLDSMEGADSC